MNKELIEILNNIRKFGPSITCNKLVMYYCTSTSCINCPLNNNIEEYKRIYSIHYGDIIIQLGNL